MPTGKNAKVDAITDSADLENVLDRLAGISCTDCTRAVSVFALAARQTMRRRRSDSPPVPPARCVNLNGTRDRANDTAVNCPSAVCGKATCQLLQVHLLLLLQSFFNNVGIVTSAILFLSVQKQQLLSRNVIVNKRNKTFETHRRNYKWLNPLNPRPG